MYADDDELVALCEPMRNHGGFYCPHHRNYGLHALEAYQDSIEIARRAGVPLHLAHAHLGYEVNRGRAHELLAMIDRARADAFHDIPMDWSIVVISGVRSEAARRWVGRSVAESAAEAGRWPIDFVCELLAEEELGVACIAHIGNEENVRAIMTHPAHTAGSDGILVGEQPHP